MARLYTLRYVRADGDRLVAAVTREAFNNRAIMLGEAVLRLRGIVDRNGELLPYVPAAVKAAIAAGGHPVIVARNNVTLVETTMAVVHSTLAADLITVANQMLFRSELSQFTLFTRPINAAEIAEVNAAEAALPPV